MNQTELEKTELEIAKLKLAQEKHKLEQLQKRQKVVDGLGQGAAAVGGAAKSGAQWVLYVVFGVTVGALLGWVAAAFTVLVDTGVQCAAYPDADLLYRMGCALGSGHTRLVVSSLIAAVVGAYGGHNMYSKKL